MRAWAGEETPTRRGNGQRDTAEETGATKETQGGDLVSIGLETEKQAPLTLQMEEQDRDHSHRAQSINRRTVRNRGHRERPISLD
jgi:hypothetical protein